MIGGIEVLLVILIGAFIAYRIHHRRRRVTEDVKVRIGGILTGIAVGYMAARLTQRHGEGIKHGKQYRD